MLALLPAAAALASSSHVRLWTALGGRVVCGLAVGAPHAPRQLLCASRVVPAPANSSPAEGDPGFVFLRSRGRAKPARLSQDTFAGTGNPVALASGTRWQLRALGASCKIMAASVRCANRSHHGFTLTRHSYKPF
jgi:hypothetical protein